MKVPPETKPVSDELREVADELQRISDAVQCGRQGLVNAATLAGRLMLEAMACGLFDGPQWLGLRHVVEMATRGELEHQLAHLPGTRDERGSLSPAPGFHAFLNGCVWIWRCGNEPTGEFDRSFVCRGCALLIKHIQTQLKRLEKPTPVVDPLPTPDREHWLRFVEAERITSIARGTLKRAADGGELIDNGMTGDDRRIDAGSLCRYALERAQRPEPTETPEQVNRLFKKHAD